MTLDFGALNWVAIILATVAYFVLGGIWYSPPVFGKVWRKSMGMQDAQRPTTPQIVAPLFIHFISVVVLALLVDATGSSGASEGMTLGLVVAVGFNLAVLASTAVFETSKPDPRAWFLVTAAYNVVALGVAGAIIGGM